MTLTFGAVAAIAVVVAGVLKWQKAWPKVADWLMLLGGLGVAGLFGGLLDKLANVLSGIAETGTRVAFGTAVSGVVAAAMGVFLFIRMRPKGAGPSKKSWLIALVFPSVLAAATGFNAAPWVADVFSTIWGAGSQVYTDTQAGR